MKKPNVLLIVADDMGYGDFSYFNNGLSETPFLDSIIKDGICLSQHYSAAPICAPARASLLTGRYPHRTGVIDTLEINGLDRLAPGETTMADVLKNSGYATGIIGKWHLGSIDPEYHPNRRGFDEFTGFRGGWQDYYDWKLYYNEELVKSNGRYLTDVFTEEAINFVRRHKKEPFFLHLAYNAPHVPLQVPTEEIIPFVQKPQKFTMGVCLLYGMLRRMDRGIEMLLEEIKKLGLEKSTVVFFTSDNGPEFSGKGDMSIARFNYGFKGHKDYIYEGGIRVPMLIKNPCLFKQRGMIDEMVHFVDWFPTILDMCGIKIPPGIRKLDGKNILPVLKGEKIEYGKRFWQWNRLVPVRNSNIAMRDGKWKLLKPPIPETMKIPQWKERLQKMNTEYTVNPEKFRNIIYEPLPEFKITGKNLSQLFNIEDDPFETKNIALEYPAIVEKMEAETDKWFEDVETERKSIRSNCSTKAKKL